MFPPRYFPRGLTTSLFVAGIFTFMVVTKFQKSGKNTSMTPTNQIEPTNDPFTNLVVERIQASRKLLAEHGLHVPDSVGTYQRIVLVSTWRSGSSFTGELLSKIPGAIFNYEPFIYMHARDISLRNETSARKYVEQLSSLLQCDYRPFFTKDRPEPLKPRRLFRNNVYKYCREVQSTNYCQNTDILSQACRYFPIQVSKLVRMPLRHLVHFLRKPELNLHVVLLVRDPRGTMASRRKTGWCKKDCADPEKLCDLLRDNYDTALRAAKEFPEHFTVVRYEDIAMDPENVSSVLLKRLGIPVTPSIGEYIKLHTASSVEVSGPTFRARGSRVTRWKQTLPWEDIQKTQNTCQDVLEKYGYVSVDSVDALNGTKTFHSVWKLPVNV